VAKRLPALQIKGDLCVGALVDDFSAIHFSSKFLDVIERIFRRVFVPSLTAPCVVSSQLLATLRVRTLQRCTAKLSVLPLKGAREHNKNFRACRLAA
jgi:hypothetical protein